MKTGSRGQYLTIRVISMAILTILEAGTARLADQANSNNLKKRETYVATASEPSAVARPRTFGLSVYIDSYSTEEETAELLNALRINGSHGFQKALSELKTRGRVVIPGRAGYEAKFIRQSPTSSGREVRIVLDRRMSFMESYYGESSKDYGVSALEISLNGQNKGDGILYALSKPHFDQKNHQLVLENIENRPWRLTNIR
jgi:hypothetical protein